VRCVVSGDDPRALGTEGREFTVHPSHRERLGMDRRIYSAKRQFPALLTINDALI